MDRRQARVPRMHADRVLGYGAMASCQLCIEVFDFYERIRLFHLRDREHRDVGLLAGSKTQVRCSESV